MGPSSIRVLCVDDHPLILEGVGAILATEPGMMVVGQCLTGEHSVQLFREHLPDVTLMDLRMPGMGGVAAIRAIRAEIPHARVIAMTTYKGDEDIHRALEAGARGYLLKDLMRRELTEAIRKVHAGARFLPPEVAVRLAEHTPRIAMTPRELEVLRRMAEGMRNKEIAADLQIGEETVKFHVRGILAKLSVSDRTHAVTTALRRGILHLE